MKKLSVFLCVVLLVSFPLINIAQAEDFPKLDEAIPGDFVSRLAPVFDFDTNGCLPSAGISRDGIQNPGLDTGGAIDGNCYGVNPEHFFLPTSNTLHRHACTSRNGSTYCGHFYALYFEKDQYFILGVPAGHRHDWEYAAVWTTDGNITHASYSAHGELNTRALADLPLDEDGHVMFVYHKDGPTIPGYTHCLRFAAIGEVAENPHGSFVTPTLISWDNLIGHGICNDEMREKLNSFDYGSATIPLKDSNFWVNLNRFKPSSYPAFCPQVHEDCEATASFSEEYPSVQRCPPGYVVTGIMCSGDYCDNKQLMCCRIPGLTLEGPEIPSSYFSEEGTNYFMDDNLAVIGMQCTGSYCDNISLIMRVANVGTGGEWTEPFSDYAQGYCDGGYVAGVKCTGSYCDNLSLYCKKPELLDSDNDGLPDYYENDHGFNPLNSEDAVWDADNDGFSNLREYISGTNPQDDGIPFPPFVYDLDCDVDIDGKDLYQFIVEGLFDERSLLFFSEDFGRN